jgi:cytosine/adenosine deaminase-related metal-dependent hydrolase
VTLVPGLINAHAHLGLSHLAGGIPAGLGFLGWADALFARLGEPLDEAALIRTVDEMRATGTCLVADVVGSGGEVVRRVLDTAGLGGVLFREYSGRLRGVFAPRPLPGVWSAGVHSLYSTDPALARTVKHWCAVRDLPFTLHLAEVPGENELFHAGNGPLADFLRVRRILPKGFAPSGQSAVGRAQALDLLDGRTLAVHCVHVDPNDVDILAQSGASVCLCPRSNAWIGVGTAPAAALFEAGVPLCLGTDSLASSPNPDLWAELRALRLLLPRPLPELLPLVTTNPARILGISAEYGSLAPGKRAVWAVVPEDLAATV